MQDNICEAKNHELADGHATCVNKNKATRNFCSFKITDRKASFINKRNERNNSF